MPNHSLAATAVFAMCGIVGWAIAHDLASDSAKPEPRAIEIAREVSPKSKPKPRAFASKPADSFYDGTTGEIFASAKPEQMILRFPSNESYASFIDSAGESSLRIVGQLDPLRAIKVQYDDPLDLSLLLMGENIATYDSLPVVPIPRRTITSSESDAVGFGNGLLPWLGVTTDNSKWGTGVKVAVLDSGIVPHPGLPPVVQSIAIVPYPDEITATQGHGTAVASLIAGNSGLAPGIAPAVELISVRISDDDGVADCFAMAAGILAAIDAGAQIINISMGTSADNPLIEEAVLMARDRNVVIVASTGNSQQEDASYPAAYPSVISVGAVDARGEHMEFSNYASSLTLTAPGYAIDAAWPGDQFTRLSGTSASAPIVTGAIAAVMSHGSSTRLSAQQAADLIVKYTDEAGIPGPDSEYGVGILNLGRIMSRSVNGIVDASITHQRLMQSGSGLGDEIQITIQNRGTTILVNTLLEVSTPFGKRTFNATTLAPGVIQTFSIPVRMVDRTKRQTFEIHSRLTSGTPGRDKTPYNNQRSDILNFRDFR